MRQLNYYHYYQVGNAVIYEVTIINLSHVMISRKIHVDKRQNLE